ncbi:helix-turn-helix transcriptional regulator [Streptomyces uncialis]|uniref:helix-turn-helix domain-containing protein n=1 Tax=Streptomyces uncialis TaxID=1048205 RepID=UPI002E330061|nr:helix-turn-helix transcriptional regulator [Streptomyces uncialis]WST69989.1 helix-turn-helix transcriptional regulator [Streptomyces uncialis]
MDSGTTDAAEAAGAGDEDGWEVDPEDEIAPVVRMVGSRMKGWREGAGMRVVDFANAVGYGEDLVRKIERGERIARPEYLDKVDAVLRAGGKLAALKEDLAAAQYPKKIRDLARMEAQAAELCAYGNHNLHGLVQTKEYARALIGTRRPAYSPDEVERMVAGRMARHSIFERSPAPELSFVLEEVTLRRPIGGRMVLRGQLEHLLEVGRLRNVEIQVMPTATEDNAGMGGELQTLRFRDGSGVGRQDGAFAGRPVSDPRRLRIIELRYGIIRAQALTPRESLAYIKDVLGET